MAGLITVRLSRSDAQPWGFRLQGGKDFGAPLLIQKVNGGSLAEKAGLQVADAVIKVNGQDVYNLSHKSAQDTIIKAGNSFEIVVSRSPGGTWKPAVTPVGSVPSPTIGGGAPSPVTKTSLAYKGPASPAIGTGHNVSARPFSATPQLNGVGDGNVKSITSKQYNNPVNLYSEQTIAETLSAQAEVLAGGVLGVNFMKNEKAYNSNNSEVLKMVQEIDNEPRDPEPVRPSSVTFYATHSHMVGGRATSPRPSTPLAHQLPPPAPDRFPDMTPPSESPKCSECSKIIVGVFVRIKDKNLHVECFKCATCGTSLKNVGYYNINNKLYCDIHAKLVARSNPPAPNLDPVTIPPGGRIPSGAMPAPLPSKGPQSPQPGTLAPLPFHPPPSSVSAPKSFAPAPAPVSAPFSAAPAPPFSSSPAPPFSSVPAPPFSSAPAPLPFSSAPPSRPAAPVSAPFSSAPAPPSMPSFPKNLPDKEQIQDMEDVSCCKDSTKRMSVCSSEVCDLSEKKKSIKAMASVQEDTNRASPIPFNKGQLVSESFKSLAQGSLLQSENVETTQTENVHVTRKTKVEESFERSQKMYTAEISTSHSSQQVRASSPEMEQIMAKRRVYQAYDSQTQSPVPYPVHQKLQSERCLTPEIENIMEKPHGTWSPMPPACMVRPITPNQIISFPPDMPPTPTNAPPPRTATPEQFQDARETVERFVDHSKHVQSQHSASTGKSSQTYMQQSSLSSYNQQFIPRFDSNQGFSPYNGKENRGAINTQSYIDSQNNTNLSTHEVANGRNGNYHSGDFKTEEASSKGENVYEKPINPGNGNLGNNNARNGNGNNQRGNPGNDNWGQGNPEKEEPTETEPNDSEKERHSQKSSRKQSFTEEESSRRVFSDFGGPQMSSSVDVESTTEEGIQKTSVKKTEKMQSSTCEFESSRTSSIKPRDDVKVKSFEHEERKPASFDQPTETSNQKFSEGEAAAEEGEEKITKSQVEEIIKQELNKVFQMAQTMEKTNFGQMYDDKSKHASTGETHEQSKAYKSDQKSTKSFKQKIASSKMLSSSDVITKTGKLTSGLTIAPERSFTPQALESNYPLPYQNLPLDFPPPRSDQQAHERSDKPAYIPLTANRDSPFIQALTIAPDRPYSPISVVAPEPPALISQPITRSSMLDALTTAPTTPFQIHSASSENILDQSATVNVRETKFESIQKYAPQPIKKDFKPISADVGEHRKSFPPVTDGLSAFKSTSTSKFQSSSHVTESKQQQQSEMTKQTMLSSHQTNLSTSRVERPVTPSGLHPPNLLPYYQREIGEIPLAHRSNSPIPHQIMAPTITPPRAQSVPRQGEKGSVKALSEAYVQQVEAQNNQQDSLQQSGANTSSVSYVSAGAYSKGSVTKAYSYEQEHKSIDVMGYQASPLAGKLPLAGEHTIPKCSSPVLGKLDHTKQVFKPALPSQQATTAFRSPVAEQANLRQAPPFFVQEKEKPPVPWVAIKEKCDEPTNKTSARPTPPSSLPSLPQSTFQTVPKPNVPFDSSLSKTRPAFPLPSSLPGVTKLPSAIPDAGPGGAPKSAATAGTTAPRRGRGVLNAAVGAGARVPLCGSCNNQIRGPFITALGKIWCPEHFVCVNTNCRRPLQDIGFVEEGQGLYCEFCFEQYLAPTCSKCNAKVKGDCLNAIGKHFHPECFTCAYCGKLFGNSPFFLEDALPYCEADWNELFTTKCFSCGFPIEAGDRWVEALNNNYHSQCFNCTMCKKNLEGQSFFAKGGRPFCKTHAR